jgi:hypothetical protein
METFAIESFHSAGFFSENALLSTQPIGYLTHLL